MSHFTQMFLDCRTNYYIRKQLYYFKRSALCMESKIFTEVCTQGQLSSCSYNYDEGRTMTHPHLYRHTSLHKAQRTQKARLYSVKQFMPKNSIRQQVPCIFFFMAALSSMWDLSSLTWDRTCAPCTGSTEP